MILLFGTPFVRIKSRYFDIKNRKLHNSLIIHAAREKKWRTTIFLSLHIHSLSRKVYTEPLPINDRDEIRSGTEQCDLISLNLCF
jgi:hypothetical protein